MKLFYFLILSLSLFIFLISGADASLGVTPASYQINFQPDFRGSFPFTFLIDSGEQATMYAEGDLAQYVKLTNAELTGTNTIVAFVSLPSSIDIPGDHIIYIGARQAPSNEGTLGIVGDARGIIIIRVPYPGKYLESSLTATSVNQGEKSQLALTLVSKGKETVTSASTIEIYTGEKKIETINLGESTIQSTETKVFTHQLDTTAYQPGLYTAVSSTTYGDVIIQSTRVFRVGTLFIDILSYTDEFIPGKINRMEIDIASYWNDHIPSVNANVSIVGKSISFVTASLALGPFEESRLTGFFDTTDITESPFQARIVLSYAGTTSEKIVDLRFKRTIDYKLYAIIAGTALIMAILIGIILYMRRKLVEARRKK